MISPCISASWFNHHVADLGSKYFLIEFDGGHTVAHNDMWDELIVARHGILVF
jgi:hypothetical protein